jgi:molybdenum cofactor cytidylyltransferase
VILHALVLAGGAGRRFGGGKLTAPWRGGALIDGALAAALAAPASGVTVVTGADAEAVAAAVRAFNPAVALAHARDHAEGMAATLRAGIAALPPEAGGVLIFLADMPLVPASAASAVAQALQGGAIAAAPVLGGRRGHPVGLSRGLFGDVLALTGDQGARRVLDDLGERLVLIPMQDAGILVDVDRPEDLPA